MGRRSAWIALTVTIHLAGGAQADEGSFENAPAGDSVNELSSALSRAVEEPEERETLFPELKRQIQKLPTFFGESRLVGEWRTYFLPLRTTQGEFDYAFTSGGKLRFRSGWFRDFAQVGVGYYMSQKIVADDPLARTQLLRPDEESYFVAGEAYLRLKWREYSATLYRQELDLPWVNGAFSRMTPNNFEAYLVRGDHEPAGRLGNLDWVLGWITDTRLRFAQDFVSMGTAAGVPDSDAGLAVFGFQFEPLERIAGRKLYVGLYNFYSPGVLHITYLALDFLRDLPSGWAVRTQWQVTWQSSAGGTELAGSSFQTGVLTFRPALSKNGITAWLGFSATADSENIRSPWGTYPGYLSMMQSDFNRAGEIAWMLGASYDFVEVGVPGLSGFVQFGSGTGGQELGTGADRAEINLTLDYRIERGRFRGLWFRMRGSYLDVEGADSPGLQMRLVLNYDIPIL